MSRSTRDEYLQKMRCRYRRYTGRPAKGRLLDEFCLVTGHERKYATKLLSGRRGPSGSADGSPSRGGRPPTYEAEVVGVVFEIWKHSEQPCGKTIWLSFWFAQPEKFEKVACSEVPIVGYPAFAGGTYPVG